MKKNIMTRILSVLLAVATLMSLAVFTASAEDPAPADDKFADGHFKVLFIGNSASDDATDSGYQKDSKLYEIMKAMVGDSCKIDIGLCWSGGKTLAWHATAAEAGNGEYTFMYHADSDEWKILSASCSADALKYTDWDAVVIQPWGLEVTKGKATYANNESPDFVELENSVPYMLDHVATNAPTADIYYYHIWATTHDYQNLDAERKNYEAICKYTRLAETYKGTKTGATFTGVVPAGATVQALRGTYLGLLDVNNDASVIDHTTDPQMGLQRDGVHMSFCIGRYAVGLTFAEKLIPADKRAEGYILPPLRTSQVAGELPEDYLELIELAVDAAYASAAETGKNKYNVAPLGGSPNSPLETAKNYFENYYTFNLGATPDTGSLIAQWKQQVAEVTGLDLTVNELTLDGDYTAPEKGESCEITARVTFDHGYLKGGEATVKAIVSSTVALTFNCNEGGCFYDEDGFFYEGNERVLYGSSVTVRVKADEGYKIADVKINGESDGASFIHTIESITEDTVIEAVFEKIVIKLPFTDVKEKQWFYNDVAYVYTHGLMNGVSKDKFTPNIVMNRAMIVTVLWRMDGAPKAEEGTTLPFTDVKETRWYYDALVWAYKNDIVKGMTETTFDANGMIIREQMAAIFYRYAQYKGLDITEKADISTFPDAGRVRDYAKDAMSWANAAGLITGKQEGSTVILDPRGSATRAQVAAILNRFCAKF